MALHLFSLFARWHEAECVAGAQGSASGSGRPDTLPSGCSLSFSHRDLRNPWGMLFTSHPANPSWACTMLYSNPQRIWRRNERSRQEWHLGGLCWLILHSNHGCGSYPESHIFGTLHLWNVLSFRCVNFSTVKINEYDKFFQMTSAANNLKSHHSILKENTTLCLRNAIKP